MTIGPHYYHYWNPNQYEWTYPNVPAIDISKIGLVKEKTVKPSEVMIARDALAIWLGDVKDSGDGMREIEDIVDFLIRNDYLSDKFYDEANETQNKGE